VALTQNVKMKNHKSKTDVWKNNSRAGFICLNIIVNGTAKVCVLADEGVTNKG